MSTPPHLLAQEHGVLGEARVRAFLLERFWVHTRSIDLDGADFLIQAREPAERDPNARVRLGRVQVKFVQNDRTPIYIPKAYVFDRLGLPSKLFFLVISTGTGRSAQLFLLDGEQIARCSAPKTPPPDRIRIGMRAVLESQEFVVTDSRVALERMEQALRTVDRDRYAAFLGASFPERGRLKPEYLHPLHVDEDRLDRALARIQREFGSMAWELEAAAELLRRAEASGDLLEIESILDQAEVADHILPVGYGDFRVGFSSNPGRLDDLFDEVRRYRARVERLAGAHLLAPFATLVGEIEASLIRELRRCGSAAAGEALGCKIEFDGQTFTFRSMSFHEEVTAPLGGSFTLSSPGLVVGRFRVPEYPQASRPNQISKETTWEEFLAVEAGELAIWIGKVVETARFGD